VARFEAMQQVKDDRIVIIDTFVLNDARSHNIVLNTPRHEWGSYSQR
jgi:hypothetical protein